MKEKFDKYADSFLSFFINHTLWAVIVWLFGLFTLNLPKIISFFVNNGKIFNTVSDILTILSLSVSVSVTMYISIRIKRNGKEAPPEPDEEPEKEETNIVEPPKNTKKLIDDIFFKKVVISMCIESSENIQYKMKFDGNVSNENLEEFTKQLSWSGSEYISTKLLHSTKEMTIIDNECGRTQSPYEFKLQFNEALEKDERVVFETMTLLSDKEKKMFPFSSFCVKYPIETLILELCVTKDMVKNVSVAGYNDHARESRVFSSKKNYVREDGINETKYKWTVTSPEPWRYYSIDWTFTGKY